MKAFSENIRAIVYWNIRTCTIFGLGGCLYMASLLLAIVAFIVALVPLCNASRLNDVGFDELPTV